MDESPNKNKEDAEYSEEIKILIKILIILNFQNNIIRFKLTNIVSFEKYE